MAIRAARAIIRSKGPQQLSTRAVARRIGYSPGTLYQIFRNLDDLILAVNVRTVTELRNRMQKRSADEPDPRKRLHLMARTYADYASAYPGLWRVAFEHHLPDAPVVPAALTEQTDAIFLQIVDLLRMAVPQRSDEDYRNAAAALWAGVHGTCHLAASDKLGLAGTRSVRPIIERLVDSILAGLES